ncbi:aldehyde dehydrogenase family protein [Nocardia sp. XZ_19_385]|uniref:aldehyde dehydrogenase family protein n=1 Tax=Nocardia sp. XZ_19_385 TaxID=2769488 RepID=UPI00188ED7E4|nr:aldehyde dehydrogenase family protein [Nocardia sp. XZ_19_385]
MTDIDILDPADGALFATVPDQAEDIARMVGELRLAQTAWEGLGAAGRARWLGRLRDWLVDNTNGVAEVIRRESGKPIGEALLEVAIAVDHMTYYVRNAERFQRARRPWPHGPLTALKRLSVTYHPYPVVGVITPWNFPLAQATLDLVPALLAGAAVIVKPSEFTPLAIQELAVGWAEIGAPTVFAAATGAAAAGAAVVDAVDYVQFTGSTRTGRQIAARAGTRLIPCGLELGGKDPAIVLPDADLAFAAKGIVWGGLANAGQMCTAVERVYVHSSVHEEFVRLLTAEVEQLTVDTTGGPATDIGPLTTQAQRAIVESQLAQALDAGAHARTGGIPTGDGTLVAPTVLVDVDHSMVVMREETFGPVLPVMAYDNLDEAIRLANDSPYGLSASVWTRDRRAGEQVAAQLQVGAVDVNDVQAHLLCFPLPMHGWKESGIGGRHGGAEGVLKYCRPQSITTPRVSLHRLNVLIWFPYTPFKSALIARTVRLFDASGVPRRLGLK